MGLIEPYILSTTASDDEFVNGDNKNHNVEKYISELRDPKIQEMNMIKIGIIQNC